MEYELKFPTPSISKKFRKTISKIPTRNTQDAIMKAVENLSIDPRPFGKKLFKTLSPPISLFNFTAQYRIRVGDFRVLYDIDDKNRTVWIIALRRRTERTYK